MPSADPPERDRPRQRLPPAAATRLAEMRDTRTWGSTLGVDEFAAMTTSWSSGRRYRHDDWLTRGQTRWTAGNAEVEGYSYLVRQLRTDARNELELDLVRMGAEGVVVRELETQISGRRCPIVPFGKDHVVQATIVGTAIVQFAALAPPPHLRHPAAERTSARAAAASAGLDRVRWRSPAGRARGRRCGTRPGGISRPAGPGESGPVIVASRWAVR